MKNQEKKHKTVLDELKMMYPQLKEVPELFFSEAIDSYYRGQQWVLKKYNIEEKPDLNIGHINGQKGTTGLIKVKESWVINIDPVDLANLASIEEITSAVLEEDYAGFVVRQTLSQLFESIGIEENMHYAQALEKTKIKLPENSKLLQPRSSETDDLDYFLQPHEFEAIVNIQEFFSTHYQDNPYEGLAEYLLGKKSL